VSPVQNAFYLAYLSLEDLFYPVLIGTIALVLAGWKTHLIQRRLWKPDHWRVLAHLLLFPAAVVIGAFFAAPAAGQANEIADWLLFALVFLGSLISCIFWISRMEAFRIFAVILMATMQIPILMAWFVASMSVTGDWL
jgi:hypothetical protein